MHPRGSFFVVGNRGHDSVAVFRVADFSVADIDGAPSGGIELVGITPQRRGVSSEFRLGRQRAVPGGREPKLQHDVRLAFDENTGALSPSR